MFGMVDTAVMRDRTLPWHAKLIYAYLTTYCSDKRMAWPSRKLIAEDCGISDATAKRALKAGVDAGLWTVKHRPNGDGWSSNVYVLHDDPRGDNGVTPEAGGGVSQTPGGVSQTPGVGSHRPTNKTRKQDKEEDNLLSRAAARAEMSYANHEKLVDQIVDLVEAECGWDSNTTPLVDAMVCREEPIDFIINTAIKKANEIPY